MCRAYQEAQGSSACNPDERPPRHHAHRTLRRGGALYVLLILFEQFNSGLHPYRHLERTNLTSQPKQSPFSI